MVGSILHEKDKYSALSMNIVRYAALLLPLTIIMYAFLAESQLVPRSSWYLPSITVVLASISILVGLWQFIAKPTSPIVILTYVIMYHILGGLFILFVGGFLSPITICWLMLLVISDLYYSRFGAVCSLATLLGVMFVSMSVSDYTLETFVTYFVYAGIIGLTGSFISQLRVVQTVEHEDFIETRAQQTIQKTQLTTLVNSINEAIISTDANGVVQVYNAATLSLLDTNESLNGKRLNDIFQTYNSVGEPVNLFTSLSKENKTLQRDDLEHRFSDGEAIKLGISSSAVRSNRPSAHNKIEGYILVVRDITKSKSLEEERDEFISVVSHELRTPITIAEGTISNLQLLMERGADMSKLSTSLQTAHDQVMYLAKMVNDLSTLSRAERGVADTPEEIDVTELIQGLYSEYEKKAEKKGLVFNLDTAGKLGTVSASRLYLEEMIQNFITNALKYTQKGTVTLSAHRGSDGVTFAVKDTGIGISKGDQKKIFSKFYRSEDYRTRETAGTGLGLYVVEKLSHKLGVKIELTSRLNHGSTFSFTLKNS